MEFLDPKKQKQHHRYLMFGYAATTIGVILATVILVSLAYGFTFNKSGEVIQRGLIFVSSTPTGASVSVNDKQQSNKTNTRLLLETGRYTLKVDKTGYQSWQRSIVVNGGIVERFDYPFLIPKDLQTTTLKTFDASVAFAAQSRDRRWLVTKEQITDNNFTLYDLNNPSDPTVSLELPSTLLSAGTTTGWTLSEWSTDNRRMLVQRTYIPVGATTPAVEYIMLDRQEPTESINVSVTLAVPDTEIKLIDGKYDRYYVFDAGNKTLRRATLKEPNSKTVISNVLSYKSYSDDKLLYVSASSDDTIAQVKLQDGDTTYNIAKVPLNDTYFLDMASHDSAWYVVAGAHSQSRIAVYKNPIDSLKQLPDQPLVPVQVLKVDAPTYMAFSNNTRFIMATNGSEFYTYDVENDKGYQYVTKETLDAPQTAARWINGHQLSYVSNGKLVLFDYDYTNVRTMQSADPNFAPFFDQEYRYVYNIAQLTVDAKTNAALTQTALRIKADL